MNNLKIEDRYYDGTNAFGVSKEIHYTKSIVYSLLINNWNGFLNENSQFGLINFYFKVSPIIAKKIKENDLFPYQDNYNLSFIYIGKVKKPFTSKRTYNSDKPTISSPYQIEEELNYINFDLDEIWVYNSNTGEFIKRLNKKMD